MTKWITQDTYHTYRGSGVWHRGQHRKVLWWLLLLLFVNPYNIQYKRYFWTAPPTVGEGRWRGVLQHQWSCVDTRGTVAIGPASRLVLVCTAAYSGHFFPVKKEPFYRPLAPTPHKAITDEHVWMAGTWYTMWTGNRLPRDIYWNNGTWRYAVSAHTSSCVLILTTMTMMRWWWQWPSWQCWWQWWRRRVQIIFS